MHVNQSAVLHISLTSIIIFFGIASGQEADQGHWGYDSTDGPDEWCNIFPKSQCCGHRQSPVNIQRNDTKAMNDSLEFYNFKVLPIYAKITNNGHSAIVQMMGMDSKPYVQLRSHSSRFMLDSFHFHWGSTTNNGSEHFIDGERYSMEMHIVLINSKYKSLTEARDYFNGVVVVSFLFKTTDNANENFDILIKALSTVKPEGSQAIIKRQFPLMAILPKVSGGLFAYKGSLTTPPCSESVTWFISENMLFIHEKQIDQFRKLQAETNPKNKENATSLLSNNARPIQPMNNRFVFYLKSKFIV